MDPKLIIYHHHFYSNENTDKDAPDTNSHKIVGNDIWILKSVPTRLH